MWWVVHGGGSYTVLCLPYSYHHPSHKLDRPPPSLSSRPTVHPPMGPTRYRTCDQLTATEGQLPEGLHVPEDRQVTWSERGGGVVGGAWLGTLCRRLPPPPYSYRHPSHKPTRPPRSMSSKPTVHPPMGPTRYRTCDQLASIEVQIREGLHVLEARQVTWRERGGGVVSVVGGAWWWVLYCPMPPLFLPPPFPQA